MMIFGAITNSWRLQLEDKALIDLVGEAEAKGARHIELRQTCLGRCESGEGDDWRPSLSGLQEVVNAFPSLTYDLAMAWPCLSRQTDPQGEAWQAALKGAKLVGGDTPQLRIVDPSPFDAAWQTPDDIPEAAWGLAGLATEAARQGVILSMENSGQPIGSMAMLVDAVRERMPAEYRQYLGLCPDPTNQLRRFPDSEPLNDLDALPLDMLKIVHFKQMRSGDAWPTVDDGDLDCREMRDILTAKGYDGPAIMEIPPHDDVFAHLETSFAYLR
jgi:sugar phosphate isomerase/epimerase